MLSVFVICSFSIIQYVSFQVSSRGGDGNVKLRMVRQMGLNYDRNDKMAYDIHKCISKGRSDKFLCHWKACTRYAKLE